MQETIVVKIGGSILTDKKSMSFDVREDVLKNIASNIRELLDDGYRILLTHGVGTVGHMLVGKYGLHKGIDSKEKLLGLTITQNRVNELIRSKILKALEEAGVPAVMFYPSSLIYQSGWRIKNFYTDTIKRFFEIGFVPILSGDMVAEEDDRFKLSVCSGDQIAFELAKKFDASKVIFLVDVDGIYSSKEYLGGELIPLLTIDELEKIISGVGGSSPIDVTGGMKGKLKEALLHKDFFANGGEMWVLNGLKKDNLKNALRGKTKKFTIVKYTQ
ncbi:MAG: hypothetical protein DRJ35_04465 [Thermoprotei archaeon]|nr:MAG: hypothetical protein DRJ35_04465 [Thermoprotei archaeon]